MATAEQLGAFNLAVATGDYARAAQIAQQAGYSPEDVAAYVNANIEGLNLPSGFSVSGQDVASLYAPTPAPILNFSNQLNSLFQQYLGRLPTERESSIYAKDFGAEIDSNETAEFLRRSQQEITNRGNADVNALFEGDKIPTPDQLNQVLEASGGFGAPASLTRGIAGIPRFAAQEFTPLTFAPLRRGATQLAGPARMTGLTSGQPAFGGIYDIATRPVAATPFALPQDFVLQTGAYGAPIANPITIPAPTPASETTGSKEGGIIKMAEGGEAMPKLSASEAGSKFDMSQFVDEQGRLVGGYSRPIYDENQVVVGYDYRPYERDVVFGEELRGKEAALRLTDAEREQMMVEMAMRQGRTGVSPIRGGLAGIEVGDPMMRRRPQYYSTVEEFRPRYAEGGLANVAQNLAERGRKGDSMLVHMAPEEVAGLRALARAQGTDLTINPRTGLPEAFSLKKLFKAASFVLPFVPIPGLFGMSSLLTKSILSGVAAGASAKGGFDLKQALGGGLRAYALGSLGEKMSGAATPGGTPTTPQVTAPEAATVDVMGSGAPTVTTPSGDVSLAGSYTGPATPASLPGAPQYQFSVQGPDVGGAGVAVPTRLDAPFSPGDPTVPRPEGTSSFVTPEGQGFGQPLTKGTDIAMAGLGGLSIEEGAKEARRYELEAAAARREDEERKRKFDELFARTLGNVRTAKAGGSINLAKGGMTYMEAGGTTDVTGEPRMVQGTGDGMSDSVPATIEGIQEARLANDEFVIPADVVADIGNGSSNAGAKKLYDMMDRVRKARHGTTKQPPEIKAERLMPA